MPSNMEKEIRCPSMEGTVSNSKRILSRDKLIILKFSSSISNTLLSYELMHSLTSDVIENIVAKSFSPVTFLLLCPFLSYRFVEKIYTILSLETLRCTTLKRVMIMIYNEQM